MSDKLQFVAPWMGEIDANTSDKLAFAGHSRRLKQ